MKLIEPLAVRDRIADKHNWVTIQEIADGLKMSTNTTSRVLSGKPAQYKTIKTLADAIDSAVSEIAVNAGN